MYILPCGTCSHSTIIGCGTCSEIAGKPEIPEITWSPQIDTNQSLIQFANDHSVTAAIDEMFLAHKTCSPVELLKYD